jgi:hypothetical protein
MDGHRRRHTPSTRVHPGEPQHRVVVEQQAQRKCSASSADSSSKSSASSISPRSARNASATGRRRCSGTSRATGRNDDLLAARGEIDQAGELTLGLMHADADHGDTIATHLPTTGSLAPEAGGPSLSAGSGRRARRSRSRVPRAPARAPRERHPAVARARHRVRRGGRSNGGARDRVADTGPSSR